MFIDLSEFIFHQKKLKYSDLRPLWAPCWSCAQFPDTSIMLCLPKTIGYRQEPTSFFHTKTTFLSSRKFKLPPKPCFICVSLTPYAWILRIFHVKITNKNESFLAFCKCTYYSTKLRPNSPCHISNERPWFLLQDDVIIIPNHLISLEISAKNYAVICTIIQDGRARCRRAVGVAQIERNFQQILRPQNGLQKGNKWYEWRVWSLYYTIVV